MPVLPSWLTEPLWGQFAALRPARSAYVPTHPRGCHRPRISARMSETGVVSGAAGEPAGAAALQGAGVAQLADVVPEQHPQIAAITVIHRDGRALLRHEKGSGTGQASWALAAERLRPYTEEDQSSGVR